MLFATPIAVIVNTVMARRDAAKAAGLAAHVAEQLVKSNEAVAETAKTQGSKLDQIHVLVNSNMTAQMQSELDAYRANLVLMEDISALRKAAGESPRIEAITAMETTKARIAELEAQLVDRLKSK